LYRYKAIWCKVIVILFVIISLTWGETYKIFNSTFADQEIQEDFNEVVIQYSEKYIQG